MNKTISGALLKEVAGLADAVYDDKGKNLFMNLDKPLEIDDYKYKILDIAEESNGFAAMLVKKTGGDNSNNIEYAIVFRGTESSDVRDIYTDIKILTSNSNEQYKSVDKFVIKSLETIKNDLNLSSIDEAKKHSIVLGHSLAGNHAQIAAIEHDMKAYTVSALPATNIIEELTLRNLQKLGSFTKEEAFNALQDITQKANKNIVNILTDDDLLIGGAKLLTNGNLGQNVIIEGVGHSIEATRKAIDINKDYSIEVQDLSLIEKAVKKLNDFLADVFGLKTNTYKDKQYVDFATALKYFNEDGTVNFAQFLADTINISLYDPIALDLNNNGKIDTLSLENGVFFDHNGDKVAFKSSWVNSSDGILVRDIDGDGKITSGAELFGNFTKLKNGELAKNGAEALKDLDSDDNGVFDESDKAFNEILVWQDYNSNGKAESGELKSLSEHGIKSINLEFLDDNTALDKDNKQILVGSFAINDSDNALASDIDFSVNTVEREMAESAGLIKGTGFVRDLADALVLSANSDNALVDIYNEFASLDEKQKQLKILPKLVNEWAKTSKHYKSINDDESFLQQNKINIVNIRSDVSTSYVNSLKSNDKVAINQELENTNNANIQSLTPSGLNKLLNQRNIDQDLLKQVLELKDKYSVLQAFSGKDIQTLYYDSNEDLLNIKANITKSYQAILDYTYKSSLMQTRLKEYANDLKLLVDTNMQDDSLKTLIDYSDALNKLENKAKDNLKEAFIDLIEFSDVFDDLSSLKQANDLVSKLTNQAIDNNEIYYVLDLLDNNDILVNNLKDVLITKTINNENIYDLDAITSKLNVNIITNKDENNKLQGSNKDDIIISSKTNEDLVGNGGNDVYVFSKDWGKDIVYSYHNNKQSISLRFNDIKLNEIELSTNKNNDLIITDIANSNNEIFIQNALYDGEYKIDKIILEDISLEFEEIKLLAYNKIEQGV
nr:hypothetical protein [uncultured Campylobacter sp.]